MMATLRLIACLVLALLLLGAAYLFGYVVGGRTATEGMIRQQERQEAHAKALVPWDELAGLAAAVRGLPRVPDRDLRRSSAAIARERLIALRAPFADAVDELSIGIAELLDGWEHELMRYEQGLQIERVCAPEDVQAWRDAPPELWPYLPGLDAALARLRATLSDEERGALNRALDAEGVGLGPRFEAYRAVRGVYERMSR